MFRNFTKRIRSFFFSPRRALRDVLPDLLEFRRALQRFERSTNPIADIVPFFDAVSKWHDRGLHDVIAAFQAVNYAQYDDVVGVLETLQKHLDNAGRGAMNRTKSGQTVTPDRVFLGDVWGIWEFPVSFWLAQPEDGPSELKCNNGLGVKANIVLQARMFMWSHCGPMVQLIDHIETATG